MYAKDKSTIADRREMLRVKIKSLAAEATIIRKEAMRAGHGDLREELVDHRRTIVRSESRHSQIALAIIRGIPYDRVEPKAKHAPDWKRVRALAVKYGVPMFNEDHKAFIERVEAYVGQAH